MTDDVIGDYIAQQREDIQPLLRQVRATIRQELPDAIERIAWQMPSFWQVKYVIHFAAFKNHLGIYPGDLSLLPFEDRLVGYSRTKGAIQFPYDKPIDFALIAGIASYRLKMILDAPA